MSYQATNGTTGYVPLKELATIGVNTGASWIYHENGERFIPIKFSVRGRDLGGTVSEAQERIRRNVRLPPGYRLEWSGEFGELQEAQKRLAVIVPVSLILIFGLLYSLFNSLRESLLSLLGMPFTVAGGILGLYFSGQYFSISAAIGFISLFGVSVMIGILLVTYYRRAWIHGGKPIDAMRDAAFSLMRPFAHDEPVCGDRPFPGGDFPRHRQRSPTSARDRGGGWHDAGVGGPADRGSGVDAHFPGKESRGPQWPGCSDMKFIHVAGAARPGVGP